MYASQRKEHHAFSHYTNVHCNGDKSGTFFILYTVFQFQIEINYKRLSFVQRHQFIAVFKMEKSCFKLLFSAKLYPDYPQILEKVVTFECPEYYKLSRVIDFY